MNNIGNKPFRRNRHRCPIPKSTFTTFMDEGWMHFRSRAFRKALYCFDRALELKSTDKTALVARSQCYLKLGNASSALKDAQSSFGEKDLFVKGIYHYAEALFSLGQFEKSLIAFQGGRRMRKDMDGFRIGVQKCHEAIMKAIGDKAATQIEDLDDLIPLILELEALKKAKPNFCCIRPDSESELMKKKGKLHAPSKARAKWVSREVLGQMYTDKDYLSKFLHRQDVQSDQGASIALRRNATEALGFLRIREHFWRQQNPMYSRKYGLNFNNNMVIQYEADERERQEQCRRIKMDAAEGAVLKNISLIEHSLEIKRPKDCQLECERTLRQMRKITRTVLPRKSEFLCTIHHYKGMAQMALKNYDGAAVSFQTEFNIAAEEHMTDIKSKALDHLGKAFAMKKSYAEAAEIWETRIVLAKTHVDRAYLFHEIGLCYLQMGKLDMSKYYALQALDEALKINDTIWAMNARIMLGQIEIKNMNLETASIHFDLAASFADQCGNKQNMTLALEAIQCLRLWIEKRRKAEEEEEESRERTGSTGSLGDKLKLDDAAGADVDPAHHPILVMSTTSAADVVHIPPHAKRDVSRRTSMMPKSAADRERKTSMMPKSAADRERKTSMMPKSVAEHERKKSRFI